MSANPQNPDTYRGRLPNWQFPAMAGGIILLALSAIGAYFDPAGFFRSYLMGYLFWIGLGLGSMGLVMVQYLTGGAWGVVSRRTLEAAMLTLPVLAVLFIPVLVGMPQLYEWARTDAVQANPVLQHRQPYMNPSLFTVRAILYFAAWMGLAYLLSKWSKEEDRVGDQTRRLARLSAPGLVLYVFTMTFASVDWAESLMTHWFSTIWGFLFVVSQGLTAMAFLIAVLALLTRRKPMSDVVNRFHFHDLGKLLFMFVMLWGYMAFSQFLIVWTGNLTGEIPFYLPSFKTSWGWVGMGLLLFQFLVPFLLLLSAKLKQNPIAMCGVVGIVIFMRFVDLFWIVMPDYATSGVSLHWLNITVPVAIGGIWVAAFLWQLNRRPLLPLRAPNLEGALRHGMD